MEFRFTFSTFEKQNKHAKIKSIRRNKIRKIPVTVYSSEAEATKVVADRIAKLIKDKQAKGEKAVLGLATGVTPIKVYQELVRLHKEEGLSFNNVVTFNLDEYYPMLPNEPQSYVTFMNENLFNHVDVPKENIHIPDGSIKEEEVAEFCKEYEQKLTHLED